MEKTIAFIGAGGINSWAIQHLNETLKIFNEYNSVIVKIFDGDEIEEKNILRGHQNFVADDILEPKAKVLAERFNYLYDEEYITEDNIDNKLSNVDDIIMGVDNHKTRQLIYKYCLDHNKYLLDLRAQGTLISFYILDHSKSMDYYNKTMFNNKELLNRKGSCQLKNDIENDNIQTGNKIIAYFGICGIYLKHLRDEESAIKEFKIIY